MPSLTISSGMVRAKGKDDQYMACGSAPNADPNKHAFWHPVWHLGIGNMEGTDVGN